MHDSEVIIPGTVLRVYFFQMIRANISIVRGELIGVANGKIRDSPRRRDPSKKYAPETLW